MMTICKVCRPMCAVTERMWQNRQRNMAHRPEPLRRYRWFWRLLGYR